jgi:F420-dependent oxidoreductase-like protein
MRFSFWPGPNNSWEDVLFLSQHAERTGWDRIWFADHFMPNAADVSGPTLECWTVLTALAALVPRVRIGPLVVGNTYRHPAVLAKMAANVDIISGGRLVLGLGAGWQENEHAAYGIPFYTVGQRLRRLEEACELITRLLSEPRTTFEGRYYQLTEAPLEPKPIQRPVPILIGGGGEQMTLRIAARYANEWNTWGSPGHLAQKIGVLEQRCEEIGRDPREIERSANALLVLTEDKAVLERVKGSGRPVIGGGVGEVTEIIGAYREAGVDEVIIPDFNLGSRERKVEAMDRFITEVAPAFR